MEKEEEEEEEEEEGGGGRRREGEERSGMEAAEGQLEKRKNTGGITP